MNKCVVYESKVFNIINSYGNLQNNKSKLKIFAPGSFVGYLCDEAGVAVHVVRDLLQPTVGQRNIVSSSSDVIITGLDMVVHVAGVVIFDAPCELILGRLEAVFGALVLATTVCRAEGDQAKQQENQ